MPSTVHISGLTTLLYRGVRLTGLHQLPCLVSSQYQPPSLLSFSSHLAGTSRSFRSRRYYHLEKFALLPASGHLQFYTSESVMRVITHLEGPLPTLLSVGLLTDCGNVGFMSQRADTVSSSKDLDSFRGRRGDF